MQQVRRKVLLILALATLFLSLLAAISLASITAAQAKGIEDFVVGTEQEKTDFDKTLESCNTLEYNITCDDKLCVQVGGESVTVDEFPYTLHEPTRLGYRFEGWYTDSDYTNRVTEIESTSDGILYAKWEEKTIAEMYNTQTDTYEIATFNQLKGLKDLEKYNPVYGGYAINEKVSLLKNITMSGKWTPLGMFIGTFEGNGHTLYKMNIDVTNFGLFGFFNSIHNGTVKNLIFSQASFTVTNTDETQPRNVGIIAGINAGTIRGCRVEGSSITIELYNSKVGGIAGTTDEGGTIDNCTNSSVHITGSGLIGGIVGLASWSSKITGCENHGTITYKFKNQSGCAAGIAGKINHSAQVTNCTNGGYIVYGSNYSWNVNIRPSMAQIVGWNAGGSMYENHITENRCDFKKMTNAQQTHCSYNDCGREGPDEGA